MAGDSIAAQCPFCRKVLGLGRQAAGIPVLCPYCKRRFKTGGPPPPPPHRPQVRGTACPASRATLMWTVVAAALGMVFLVSGAVFLVRSRCAFSRADSEDGASQGGNENGDEIEAVITGYGRYTSDTVGSVEVDGASGGVALLSTGHRHIETTRIIPCRIGENWGFSFRFLNWPAERTVVYRSVMHHPPVRQPNGSVLTNTVIRISVKPGQAPPDAEIWGFCQGYEYELVPGIWTRNVYVDDKEVASLSFKVVEISSGGSAPPSRPTPSVPPSSRPTPKQNGTTSGIDATQRYRRQGLIPAKNISVEGEPGLTEFEFVGLTFRQKVVLDVLRDGTVLVHEEGIVAETGDGRRWRSREIALDGEEVIAFLPDGSTRASSPGGSDRPSRSDAPSIRSNPPQLPAYTVELTGTNPVRVRNPNPFSVSAGIRQVR